jgi:hypothetical protein
MCSDSIHDSVWCAERRGRTRARSIDAAIITHSTYGCDCRLPNGFYRRSLSKRSQNRRCVLDFAALPLCRINDDRLARRGLTFLLRGFSCDVPDFPGDRNGLKRIRGGKLLQKLLNLCGFVVSDNHINLSLGLSLRQRVDLWKSSPPVSRPSM